MIRIFTFGLLTGLAFDLCTAQQQPSRDFSCKDRASGYYADVSSGCQLYHMCDGLGRQFSYTCPNATLFQQRMLVCDHWYMVNCSRSEDDYSANLLIGQKKPFVEDSRTHPYSRTPRPDLLSHPSSESEYNIIYRTGKSYKPPANIVGIEQESQQSTYADEPTYFPPSHWSTEYPNHVTTPKSVRGTSNNRRISNQDNTKQNFPTRTTNQYYDSRNTNQYNNNRNYPSRTTGQTYDNGNYQQGTPNQNYDKTNYSVGKKNVVNSAKNKQSKAININSSNRNGNNDIGSNIRDSKYRIKYSTESSRDPTNYKSSFKATTPAFPSAIETRTIPVHNQANIRVTSPTTPLVIEVTPTSTETSVNYKSNFKATTPVFPITVEESSEAPNEIGILPPIPYRNSKPNGDNPETDSKGSESSYRGPEVKSEEPQINSQTTITGTNSGSSNSKFTQTNGVDVSTIQENLGGISENNGHTQVNFRSDFKATTPVYPTFVDLKNSKSSGVANTEDDEPQINFQSNFRATTPVYPSAEEVKKLDVETDYSSILETPPKKEPPVNFESSFKATTPVYPTSVEPTSPDPGEAGLLPPESNGTGLGQGVAAEVPKESPDVPTLNLSIEPPKFDENYKKDPAHSETTINPPSMFYEPPKVDPDFTSTDPEIVAKPGIEIENIMKSLTREQWQNLRQRFHIPEYDFPLDDATRPSYDSILSSFAAKVPEKR